MPFLYFIVFSSKRNPASQETIFLLLFGWMTKRVSGVQANLKHIVTQGWSYYRDVCERSWNPRQLYAVCALLQNSTPGNRLHYGSLPGRVD